MRRPRLTPSVADTRRLLRETLSCFVEPGDAVIVGLSGGGDSLALTAAVAFEAKKLEIRAIACIINHNLQSGSELVAEKAKQQAIDLGIEAEVMSVAVLDEGHGPEGNARKARYQALDAMREKYQAKFVLLAHNLDDQAESVLLGLTRGSGANSLSGMRERSGYYLRPYLGIDRTMLRQACQDQNLEFWDDPQNEDLDFRRVRIRKLIAELETDIGPGIAAALARSADALQEVSDLVDALATKLLDEAASGNSLEISAVAAAPDAVRRQALHIMAKRSGAIGVSRQQVLAIDSLITNWHGQISVSLAGITVGRVGNRLTFG